MLSAQPLVCRMKRVELERKGGGGKVIVLLGKNSKSSKKNQRKVESRPILIPYLESRIKDPRRSGGKLDRLSH